MRSIPQAPSEPGPATYVGVIVASETVNLSAELRGRLETVSVRPGERVSRGMVLAEIQPLNLPEQIVSADAAVQVARSGVSQAETALRLARERVSRVEAAPEMFSAEQRSVALGNRDTSEKELESARARLVQAEAELGRLRGQSARRVLRAPADGWVAARLLDPGALVEAGEPVVRLKRGDRYLLRFAVPPAEAARWASGTSILWRPDGQEDTHRAVVARVAQQVDPASQMVFVEADLDGASSSGLIRDGLVVRVEPRTPG
ncbi:MAG: efflux RND transporter periplasmic adaptor subunit [Acidobacteriota bacterium]